MKNKKIYRIILILIISIQLFSITSFAHKGRTDGSGGHYDRSTGEYHYHHGYGPHQHIDGICPYDYDNKEKINTSESIKTDLSEEDDDTYEAIAKSETINKKEENLIFKNICGFIIGFWWLVIPMLFWICNYIKEKFFDKSEDSKEDNKDINDKKENDSQEEYKQQDDIKTTNIKQSSIRNYTCPRCGGKTIIKHGKYGAFIGCSNYPRCKYTKKLNKK